MKKLLLILVLVSLLPCRMVALPQTTQTSATHIANSLEKLPASDRLAFDEAMESLASTGADGIVQLAGMLVDAKNGENAIIEYAFYGLTSYVTAPSHDTARPHVIEGLKVAIDKCSNNANKAFLMSMLQRCAIGEDANFFAKYVKHAYLADWAVNGLAYVDGTDDVLLEIINRDGANREKLAYAAGTKKLGAAETTLISWLTDADAATAKAVYHALSLLGGSKSLNVLKKQAESAGYEYVPETDVTAAYLCLIGRLSAIGDKGAYKAAKNLLSETDKSHVRSAALNAIVAFDGMKAHDIVLEAVKDDDREYRVNALRLSEQFADDQWYADVANILKNEKNAQVKIDILNWLGDNQVASQVEAVVSCMESTEKEIVVASIGAVSKIGGKKALDALITQLGGANNDEAIRALLSFNGDITTGVLSALDGDKPSKVAALKLASMRSLDEAANKVFEELKSPDDEIASVAYQALAGVVATDDVGRICLLFESDGGRHTVEIQQALKEALKPLPSDKQQSAIMPALRNSNNVSLYYPILAQVGTSESIAEIMKGYNGNYKSEAFLSLLNVDNPEMIEILYDIAVSDVELAQKALNRYAVLVYYSDNTPARKCQLYSRAMELATDADVQKRLINMLGETYTYPAFLLVAKYLDDKATAETAAQAVRTIISKNATTFGGETVRRALEKSMAIFNAIDDADAGYAVDDIKTILQKIPDAEYNESE